MRKTTTAANLDHVDNRQLMQVLNESQTSNTTTIASTNTNASMKISSMLPSAAGVNDKSKHLRKTSMQTHDGDLIQTSPTWKTFIWTNDVSQCYR